MAIDQVGRLPRGAPGGLRGTAQDALADAERQRAAGAQRPMFSRRAEFVRDDLAPMGVPAELVAFEKGHPIVYGASGDVPGKPTLLVYGHYDVQPADKTARAAGTLAAVRADRPRRQPLRPRRHRRQRPDVHPSEGRRGLAQDGRHAADQRQVSSSKGRKKSAAPNLEAFVAGNKTKLACDYAVISDTSQFAPGLPAITYGLKGLAYFELIGCKARTATCTRAPSAAAWPEPAQRPGGDPGHLQGRGRPGGHRRVL